MTQAELEHGEIDDSMHEMDGTESTPAEGRRLASLYTAVEALVDAEQSWSSNTRGVAARVGRLHLPEGARALPELQIVNAQIEIARRTCGWQ